MMNVEVKHHDDKPRVDKKTGKIKTYLEKYTINDESAEKWVKRLQDELMKISKKYKSIYSIKFYIQ